MFLCAKCQQKSDEIKSALPSIGPCEECGAVAMCMDVEISVCSICHGSGCDFCTTELAEELEVEG